MTAQWSLTSYVKNFDYTGGEQTWTAPYAGYYKLEVWGAQGGGAYIATYRGGYGSYSIGLAKITNKSQTHYINVGGAGTESPQYTCNISGGYNGGGTANNCEQNIATLRTGSGGGATHMAIVSGVLQNLSAHANNGNILLVAGGGGGGDYSYFASNNWYRSTGANAGGIKGNDSHGDTSASVTGGYNGKNYLPCSGGAQSTIKSVCGEYQYKDSATSGTFGKGANRPNYGTAAGGGGGYYGGGAGKNWAGAGGSGYIGSSNLISGLGVTKHMTCYSCTTSTAASTYTISNTNVSSTATADYSKTGNGYARITWMGDTL